MIRSLTHQKPSQCACAPTRPSRAVRVRAAAPDAAAGAPATDRRRLLLSAGAALTAGAAMPGAPGPRGAPLSAAAAAEAAASPLPLVPKAELTPRVSVSRVIKGCWQLSGGHKGDRETDRTAGKEAVADFRAFYDAGITSFDMADHYGPAEILAGRFLASDSSLRPKCQVLTKYCVFSPLEMASVSAAAVRKAVDTSRKRLGVDSVDVMQFYWGSYDVPRYVDAALYLMDLRAEGLIKEVGVTNFDVPRLEAMTKAGVVIASNQVQYSLMDRRPQLRMADFCASNDVKLLPYGVLGGSFLTDKYLGADVRDVRADTYSKSKYGSVVVESLGGWEGLQRLLAALKPIADKHATTIANVSARWVLQQPLVPAVILGARNASHVPDHRRLFQFELDSDDLAAIAGALEGAKQPSGDCYEWERGIGRF